MDKNERCRLPSIHWLHLLPAEGHPIKTMTQKRVRNTLRDWIKEDPDFIEHHKNDIAASLEFTIVDILMKKLRKAVKMTGIKHVAVAGGVSANNGLRNAFREHAEKYGWTIYIPKFSYTTDNAAMIGITGYYKYLDADFCSIDKPAFSKVTFK